LKSIQDHRDFYANFVVRSSGSSNQRLIAAFASVERERFVGEGPWPIFVGSGYIPTVSDDPRLLYQDVLVGLATDRGINNGQPSLHARCLAACNPCDAESVVHIGAGTGYYSAILASMVGTTGRVLAYEIEPDLALRARANLAQCPNVEVVGASAAEATLPAADLIYVNAGATHPLAAWLDALNIGGRLVFPLTPNEGFGCMLMVTRRGVASYGASVITRVAFIPCIGARDDAASNALAAALETQSLKSVKSLRRGTQPDDTAWCVGAGWWLSTAQPD
jgi:protein-L-isoaspartate(D-aspartate) O-methyltransferase